MADQRSKTPTMAPVPARRASSPTTPPAPTETHDEDDRIVFSSWDAPLVPPER